MEQEFTILENKRVGRNIYKHRKIKDVKAADIASYIGISESQFTKYERGESQITIDIIQKIAEYLKVDPLNILSSSSGYFIENVSVTSPNSPIAINGLNQTISEEQTALITKLIENQIAMTEKLMALLEKK